MCEYMCVCVCVFVCAGAGGDVCRAGGGGEQHPEGSHPRHVDEEVLPQPQTAGKLHQRLPGATQVLTGADTCSSVQNQMLESEGDVLRLVIRARCCL